jgi:hypothetical protein
MWLERDMTGAKRFGFKIFKNFRNEENDRARINIISEEQWIQIQYYREMLVEEEGEERQTTTQHLDEQNEIKMEDLEEELRQSKNGINTELWKYESRKLKIRLLQLFNEIWNEGRIA